MIIDTSAILAIFFEEPEADHFLSTITAASSRRISAATLPEPQSSSKAAPVPRPVTNSIRS